MRSFYKFSVRIAMRLIRMQVQFKNRLRDTFRQRDNLNLLLIARTAIYLNSKSVRRSCGRSFKTGFFTFIQSDGLRRQSLLQQFQHTTSFSICQYSH